MNLLRGHERKGVSVGEAYCKTVVCKAEGHVYLEQLIARGTSVLLIVGWELDIEWEESNGTLQQRVDKAADVEIGPSDPRRPCIVGDG
jgi:hypothetical protein